MFLGSLNTGPSRKCSAAEHAQGAASKYSFFSLKRIKSNEVWPEFDALYAKKALKHPPINKGCRRFRSGRKHLEDNPRPGRPPSTSQCKISGKSSPLRRANLSAKSSRSAQWGV
jgi:hypothetical protein